MLSSLVLALAVAQTDALGPCDHTRSLTVGDLKRNYHVHVPKSYDGKRPCPVVLVYHGGAATPSRWPASAA